MIERQDFSSFEEIIKDIQKAQEEERANLPTVEDLKIRIIKAEKDPWSDLTVVCKLSPEESDQLKKDTDSWLKMVRERKQAEKGDSK